MTGIRRRLGSILGPEGKPGPRGERGNRGLPGPEAVPADAAVSSYIMEPLTASRAAVESVVADYSASGLVASTDFNNIILGTDRNEYLPPGTVAFYYSPSPKLFTDFSQDALGSVPSGWTKRWTDLQYGVENFEGENVLSVTVPAAAPMSGLSWDAIEDLLHDNNGDGELVMKHLSPDRTLPMRTLMCGSGGIGAEVGVSGNIRNATTAQLGKIENGTHSYLGTSSDLNVPTGTWLITRVRKEGSTFLGKTWQAVEGEPTGWQTQYEDAEVSHGWWGLHPRGYTGSVQIPLRVAWVGFAAGDNIAPRGE